ncbi:MAG: ATP-grasp domain-containing protein, partial [bacterium]|nr:ATP-grasp domain-containing protein [bacterium]
SNPETVSTDYDSSDLLLFEPLTYEDVLCACERLNGGPFAAPASEGVAEPSGLLRAVIVQFGGQTPLNLAQSLAAAGVPIVGTTPGSIHLAEDRDRFGQIVHELGLMQPPNGIATAPEEALRIAERIGYPVLVRPSYVLGGRGMELCNNPKDLEHYLDKAWSASERTEPTAPRAPVLIDKFLIDAIEVDVDAVSDYGSTEGQAVVRRCDICGVMEHIEEAGIHSGDSYCTLPPYSLSPSLVDEITYQVKLLARRLSVCGLMNVQFAIYQRSVYVLEVNPRASRTVPFVSKSTGVPWANIATKVMLGQSLNEALAEVGIHEVQPPRHVSVKAPVFPFDKFPGVDVILGPEMRSTGEVMGLDRSFPVAFAKAASAAGVELPTSGTVLVSVDDPDKPRVVSVGRELHDMGFQIVSTIGTHRALADGGVPSQIVSKHQGDEYPFLLDLIRGRRLAMLINTPIHKGAAWEEGRWRAVCVQERIPLITTLAGARAAVRAIRGLKSGDWDVAAVQDYMGRGRPV